MSSNLKESLVIRKLLKQTLDGEIDWERFSRASITDAEIIGSMYRYQRDENIFVIYKFRESKYHPGLDEFIASESLQFSIYDDNYRLKWDFPSGGEVYDLYEAVRKKAENIDGLLDEILGDDKGTTDDDLI